MGGRGSNLRLAARDGREAVTPRHLLALLVQQQLIVASADMSCNAPADSTCAQEVLSTAAPRRIAVVGASLGGLAAANVISQLPGFVVDVYERGQSTFENRGSGLGFVDVALWQELRGVRMMRRGRQASRSQGAFYYGDLWKYLYDGLPPGTVRFGQPVSDLGSDPTRRPTIAGQEYELVVAADGGWSGLRHHVTKSMPKYAGYVVWRGMVDAADVPGFRAFGIFKSGMYDTIALPLTADRGRDCIVCAVFVATPEAEVERPEEGASRHGGAEAERAQPKAAVPEWFLPFYRGAFGAEAGGELVRLFEAVVAQGKLTPHPQYEYGAERVRNGRLLLLGDAAHMASPRTAAGAHTAVLDAVALRDAFATVLPASAEDGGDVIDAALAVYSEGGVRRAVQLLQRSHEVSRDFVPRKLADTVSPRTLVGGRA